MTFLRTLPKAAQIALGCILVAVLIYALLMVRSCQRAPEIAAQAKVGQGQAGAFHNSAVDALNTQDAVAGNAISSEAISRSNEQDIRHAKGADQTIDPAARDAGFASLCKRPSFRNNPANRVRCSPAAVVAGASPRP